MTAMVIAALKIIRKRIGLASPILERQLKQFTIEVNDD